MCTDLCSALYEFLERCIEYFEDGCVIDQPFQARLSEGVVWTGNPKFDRMEDQSGQSSMSIAGGPTRTIWALGNAVRIRAIAFS